MLNRGVAVLLDTLREYEDGPMGQRWWCHLVSDTSYDELHEFAQTLGIPRRGFQGDHYDLPEVLVEWALAMGAEQVTSKVLIQRMFGRKRSRFR